VQAAALKAMIRDAVAEAIQRAPTLGPALREGAHCSIVGCDNQPVFSCPADRCLDHHRHYECVACPVEAVEVPPERA
jgi:hypothetical protein